MAASGVAFVTPHAVRKFQARIASHLGYDQALGAILNGLEQASNVRPSHSGDAVIVRVRRPFPFRAVVRGASQARLPIVVTILRSGS